MSQTTGRWLEAREFDKLAKEVEERAAREVLQFQQNFAAAAENKHAEILREAQIREAQFREATEAEAEHRINMLMEENQMQRQIYEREYAVVQERLA